MSNKAGVKKVKGAEAVGLVPRLRFPEFLGAGGWEKKRLGEYVRFQAGFPFDSASFNDEGRGVRLIRNRDLRSDDQRVFYSNQFDGAYLVNNGDLLVGMDGDFSPQIWVKGRALLNQRVGRVQANDPGARLFVFYFLAVHLKLIEELTARTTVKHLSQAAVESIIQPMPSLEEQQKIADCLSSLDEVITLESQRLDALKVHKKGLMQQLFPAEGETVPRLRFPEFRGAGGWEERRLKDVCEKIMDGTHFSPTSKSGPRMYLTSKNIQNGVIRLSNVFYISEEEHRHIYDRCPVRREDVLLTKDGANTGNCALNNIEFEFSLLSSVAVLRGHPSLLNQHFLYQSIMAPRLQRVIRESMSGQAITRITLEKIGGFVIAVATKDEQEKVAGFLTSIDAFIDAASQRLDALKNHKDGLMQQLFPPAEV